jgi:hypothetical protein
MDRRGEGITKRWISSRKPSALTTKLTFQDIPEEQLAMGISFPIHISFNTARVL